MGKKGTGILAKYPTQPLINSLRKNAGHYIAWEANIAMAFKDEYHRNTKKYKNKHDVNQIANRAAENFLNLLIREK